MKVLLAFPPGTDPRAPHLALPSLAAVLRRAGVETALLDLDVEGLLALLSPATVSDAARSIGRAAPVGLARAKWRRLSALGDYLASSTEDAVSVLRDNTRFYDPHEFNIARNVIADALDLVSAASAGVSYNILPIAYDVAGVDPSKLHDLIAVTDDETKNIFSSHWNDDAFPRIVAENPDIIGISITNRQQLIPGLFLARRLRRAGAFVVLGGTVLTKFVDTLRRRPAFFEHFADAVVIYEGESAILALAEQFQTARDLSKVPNLLYLDRGSVRQTDVRVEDVDTLPPPDFAGLPLDRYLAPELVLPILTGKGCYFNQCKFCDIPYINHVAKKAYRLRRPETVVEDCLSLKRRFGCRHFEITDEALSPKLLDRFADALQPFDNERFRFVGYARLEPGFSPSLCRKLSDVGFTKFFFGLESASQATLDHMDKGVDVRDAPIVLKNMRDAGIRFHLFSIIGFPQEDERSARETVGFFVENADVIDHPGNSFDIHPFGLELRTRYFSEAGALGMVIKPEALSRDFVIGLHNDDWSNAQGMGSVEVMSRIALYMAHLRGIFRKSHNVPGQFWPGFEEYSVLYADRYGDGPFPHATCLPEANDPQKYRLIVSPVAHRDEREGRIWLHGRDGEVSLSVTNYRFIFRETVETFAATARTLREAVAESDSVTVDLVYRNCVHALLGKGLAMVQLEHATAKSEERSPRWDHAR
jgi:radical SAM superfamily enzyme YgiQ (UPF0313 family)